MHSFCRHTIHCALLALSIFPATAAANPTPADAETARDVAAITTALHAAHPGSNWQSGPIRLDSPELRATYPARRFYVVRSSPPLPPGANIHDLVQAHNRAMDEWNSHHYISATVSVDPARTVRELRGNGDYNEGLKRPRSPTDLAAVAAAVFTLHGDGWDIGPVVFRAQEIRIEPGSAKGEWTARFSRGRVIGELRLGLDKNVVREIAPVPPPPMPPSMAPGR
mgnify:CR=1 FL=1